jgi:hypothetical protein
MMSNALTPSPPGEALSRHAWVLAVIVAFGVVYACSLSFVYVEGDDAASIAYHAMGRNGALQPRYAPYQAGMDLVLSVLPANEGVLRVAAMSISALAALCLVILMMNLVFDMLGDLSNREKWVLSLGAILAIPEFFYLGLYYETVGVGMCLMLASHLLLRTAVREQARRNAVNLRVALTAVLSVLLFAAGGTCEWALVLYGWVVAADLMLGTTEVGSKRVGHLGRRAVWLAAWGLAASFLWFGAVALIGYGPREVLSFARLGSGSGQRVVLSAAVTGVMASTVFTPLSLLAGGLGLVVLFSRRWRLAVVAVATAAPILLLLKFASPKHYVMFVPGIVLCLTVGLRELFFVDTGKLGRAKRGAIALLALLPWLVGIRATYDDKAWGPGFELQSYDSKRDGKTHISMTIGPGAAVPTQEGQRPIWGHGGVLLGGAWRRHVSAMENGRARALAAAIDMRVPFVNLTGSAGYIESELYRMGFRTTDEMWAGCHGAIWDRRRHLDKRANELMVIRLSESIQDFPNNADVLRQVRNAANSDVVVFHSPDPSGIRAVYRVAPGAMRRVSEVAAILDLVQLAAVVESRKSTKAEQPSSRGRGMP